MKYMLLIYSPENSWTPDEWKACVETSMGICREMADAGQFIAASPLHPVATAVTVRVRQGERFVTTGPFAETAEQLGGFYLIDVENLDEAIAYAARLPAASKGTVEIRPMLPLAGLPPDQIAEGLQAGSGDTRNFMFLCYDDEEAWVRAGTVVHQAAMQEAVELINHIDSVGQYISASPLHHSTTATSVRVRHGKTIFTDGPFAETHEVLGGFYVLRARDHESLVEFAVKHPGTRLGAVEIREVFDVSSLSINN
jgi:hypothetical protein